MFLYSKFYRILIVCLLFACVQSSFGQNSDLDSLLKSLLIESNDSTKAELLAEIGDNYYGVDFDSTVYYYKEAINVSQKIPYFSIELSCWRSLGYVHSYQKNDFDASLEFFTEALNLGTKHADSIAMAYVLSDMGRIYWKQGKSYEALEYHLQVKEIGEKIKSSKVILRACLSLGVIENEFGNNGVAKENYKEALQLARALNKDRSVALIFNNLGKAHQDDEEYNVAFNYFLQADSMFTELGDDLRLSLVNFNKGKNFTLQNFPEEGIKYYQTALKQSEKFDNNERSVMIQSGLAIAYQKLGQPDKSISIAENALRILKDTDTNLYYEELYNTLAECHESIGNNYQSLQYLKKNIQFKNEVGKLEEIKKITSLTYLYDLQKKENKILELKTTNLEKDKSLSSSRFNFNLLGIALVSVMFFSLFIFTTIRLNELKRLDQLKSSLAKNLHDNIGASLNHIKMLSNRMVNIENELEDKNTIVTKIKNISNELIYNMHDMVWSLDKEKETIDDLIIRIQDHAEVFLGDFNIPYKFSIDVPNKGLVLKTKEKLNAFLIFKESVNNILKHTETSKVAISIVKENAAHFNMEISSYYSVRKVTKMSTKIGIKSMETRAEALKGKLKVIDRPGNFIVQFSF